MSSANKDHFIFSFPVCRPFVFFSCLIALASSSSAMLNSGGALGHLALFWILGGKHLFIFTLLA